MASKALKILFAAAVASALGVSAFAQDIVLPKPSTSGGMPLSEALAKRASNRAFLAKELSPQELSDLLWAANGFNRPGKRTAPSAMNFQEIDIYALLKSGVYLYDAKDQKLVQKSKDDIRASGGKQPFVKEAPVILVFVANFERMERVAKIEEKRHWSDIDAGYISQNVYLHAASKGLATVALGFVDKAELAPKLGLKEGQQEIVLSQPVGYPDVSRIQR